MKGWVQAGEGESSTLEALKKVVQKPTAEEGGSPAIWAATLGASIPSSETIRRSLHFSKEQHDTKQMVAEYWHSRLQDLCRWVLCYTLWLLEYKSHMNCAVAAGFEDSKEDCMNQGSDFLSVSLLTHPPTVFWWRHLTSQKNESITP